MTGDKRFRLDYIWQNLMTAYRRGQLFDGIRVWASQVNDLEPTLDDREILTHMQASGARRDSSTSSGDVLGDMATQPNMAGVDKKIAFLETREDMATRGASRAEIQRAVDDTAILVWMGC